MKAKQAIIKFGKEEVVVDVPEYIETLENQVDTLLQLHTNLLTYVDKHGEKESKLQDISDKISNVFMELFGIVQEFYLHEGSIYFGYDENNYIANEMKLKSKDKKAGISYRFEIEI